MYLLALHTYFYILKETLLDRNVVHRHEPPVTSTPVRIVHHDKERGFLVIDKPGSIVMPPVFSFTLLTHSAS